MSCTNRFYSAEIILYNNLDNIQNVIDRCDFIVKYAYALHDKDTKEDGTPKKTHLHLFATFSVHLSFNQISKRLNAIDPLLNVTPENVGCIRGTREDCFLYLTHKNAPDKYPYDDSIIHTNDKNAFDGTEADEQDSKAFQLLEDIADEQLTFRQLARKYGREVILNYQKYYEYAQNMLIQERIIENGGRLQIEKEMQTPQSHKYYIYDEHGVLKREL